MNIESQLNSILFPAHHIPSVKSALLIGLGSTIACEELEELFWNDIQSQSIDPDALNINVHLNGSQSGMTPNDFHTLANHVQSLNLEATHTLDSVAHFDTFDDSLRCITQFDDVPLCFYQKKLFEADYSVVGPYDIRLEATVRVQTAHFLQPKWSTATRIYARERSMYRASFWTYHFTKWTRADRVTYDVTMSLDVASALKLRSAETLSTSLYHSLLPLYCCLDPELETLFVTLLRQSWA